MLKWDDEEEGDDEYVPRVSMAIPSVAPSG
jgi:hypothetical protein